MAGVVAAALDFRKSIRELRAVSSSIKRTPEDLTRFIQELEVLDQVLQGVTTQGVLIVALSHPAVVQKYQQSCENTINDIRLVCLELTNRLKQSESRGSIKSVLKEGVLERARRLIGGTCANLLFVLGSLSR
jgi:hypothetical protein